MAASLYVLCGPDGRVIARRITVARGLWSRMAGLIGRPALEAGEGLWLDPCNGVHTFGMRFALDILGLDREGHVALLAPGVPPGRVVSSRRGWHSTVELPAGALAHAALRVGDPVTLTPAR